MDAFILKIIALITMTIDHTGYILLNTTDFIWLRIIGRLSFPIFAFLAAVSTTKTRNIYQYAFRLIVFALISSIPFFFTNALENFTANIFYTLFFGVIAIALNKEMIKYPKLKYLSWVPFAFFSGLAFLFKTDYAMAGVLLICLFYLTIEYIKDKKLSVLALFLSLVIFNIFMIFQKNFEITIQLWSLVSIIPLAFYNGKKGFGKLKYTFYLYYPVHIMILYGIYLMLQ